MSAGSPPYIPDNAPFSTEQRSWLNGYLAGLSSGNAGANASDSHAASANVAEVLPLTILYGSQTGNSEMLARQVSKRSRACGFDPVVHDMESYSVEQLIQQQNLLLITSTYGDGDAPDSAQKLWDNLQQETLSISVKTRYSVLALGDSNYEKFCAFGIALDERLEAIGAERIFPRVDCDVDFDAVFEDWIEGALSAFKPSDDSPENTSMSIDTDTAIVTSTETNDSEESLSPDYSRTNPFHARMIHNDCLTTSDSGKEIRHMEISLEGSGLSYQVGDMLGVLPSNCPQYVEELLTLLGASGREIVPGKNKGNVSLREALLHHYDITGITKPMMAWIAEKNQDAQLAELSSPEANGEFTAFSRERQLIDLLTNKPLVAIDPVEFVGLLKKMAPRLYSIASSNRATPGYVHLTVNVVRYQSHGRNHKGVCTTFLADRVGSGLHLPVYIHANKSFCLPEDDQAPIIMVGPGTGIAPFRGFLQERKARAATGKNWLFFGNPSEQNDFIYRDELMTWQDEGLLTHLTTAFSRDQKEKIYVQHRMEQNADEIFQWLEAGAYFYVCGDASRMAKDVDVALHQCIETGGKMNADQAANYVNTLKSEKRYLRDVY